MVRIRRLIAALTVFTLSATTAHAAQIQEFEVKSRLIENFKIGSNESRFGRLEYVGGLEMVGGSQDFGAWSGIALDTDQKRFYGVADTGFWINGEIQRDASNKPIGVSARMREILDANGDAITAKWQADAEGVTLKDGHAIVSFERDHRIAIYELADDDDPIFKSQFRPPVPLYELRQNRGFEGIAFAPANSSLKGALVGVSEKSLDRNKNIMAFVRFDDGKSFEFSVLRTGEFDVTDMAFLPNGNMILLERRFNIKDGIAMRLREIEISKISSGETVDGQIILLADMGYQIDNIEGLDITADVDGTPRLTLVSDDNHSLLQRNLLLEFKLVGEPN